MNKNEIDLSIIVPAYNTEVYIERCIVSLCEQNYDSSRFEVIVIDDESPDKLRDVVHRLQIRYANLKYIWETNGRLGKARNTGVKHAQGRYIAFVDSDDCWMSRDVITTLIPLCDENKLDILQSSSYIDIAADADLEMVEIPCSNVDVFERNQYLQRGVKHFAVIFSIYRTEVIRKVAFREEVFFEDLDFTYKSIWAVGREGRIGRVNYPYYGYRKNPLSVTRPPSSIAYSGNVKALVESARFFQKCKDMEESTKYSCMNRVKNNVMRLVLFSGRYPVSTSRNVLNAVYDEDVYMLIWRYSTAWEKLWLFLLRYFSFFFLLPIRLLVVMKRGIIKIISR